MNDGARENSNGNNFDLQFYIHTAADVVVVVSGSMDFHLIIEK